MDTYVDEEYEIQHFGFSSTSFIQDFYLLQSHLLKTTLESIKSWIPSKMFEAQKNFHSDKIDKLYLESEELMKNTLEDLKPSIHAFFAIPKNVVLKTDKHAASRQDSKAALRNLEEEIVLLEKQFVKKTTLYCLCEKEIEYLESLEPFKEKVKKMMQKLRTFCARNRNDNVEQITSLYKELTNDMVNRYNKQLK